MKLPSELSVRRGICLRAAGVAAAYAAAVAATDLLYVGRYVQDGGIALGYAFCVVQIVLVSLLMISSLVVKFLRGQHDRRWERTSPAALAGLCEYLTGAAGCMPKIEEMRRRDPEIVERGIGELLTRVQGTARRRLSDLAERLGIVSLWIDRYGSRLHRRRVAAIRLLGLVDCASAAGTLVQALSDEDDDIKLDASRALIRGAGPVEMKAVFGTAVRESLLVRAVLVEALRPHAALLCQIALPDALADSDPKIVRTALQIVRAWGKVLPLSGLAPPLHHPDPRVRAGAFAILPQFPDKREFAPAIRLALSDPDERVRAAAARTAGRLRLSPVAPELERCLESSGPEATVAAAYAIAQLGPSAWPRLDAQIKNSRSAAAAAALEALEQVRTGRLLPGTA